jgi:hypothetical protein
VCEFSEHTSIAGSVVSEHIEGMSSIHSFSGSFTIFIRSALVFTPESIDSILIEETLECTFTKTKDALEVSGSCWYFNLGLNPVAV